MKRTQASGIQLVLQFSLLIRLQFLTIIGLTKFLLVEKQNVVLLWKTAVAQPLKSGLLLNNIMQFNIQILVHSKFVIVSLLGGSG